MHQRCVGRPVATGRCGAQGGPVLPKRGHRPRGTGKRRLGKVVGAGRHKLWSRQWSGGPNSASLGCRQPWPRRNPFTWPQGETLQVPELMQG